MMTPKQALEADNKNRPANERIPIKQGRGRLSREAIERIKHLVANEGYVVKGYEVSAPSTAQPDKPKQVVKVKATSDKVVSDFVILWDERQHKAVTPAGRVYGMREVCNTCRVSLVQCHCGKPTILGDIKVSIKRK